MSRMVTRALLFLLLLPTVALAQRPMLSGAERTYAPPGDHFLIHYTLAGQDALPDQTDVDPQNGVPDFLDDYATGLQRTWDVFGVEDGWPLPPGDEGRGGDDRIDAYVAAIDLNGLTHWEDVASGGHTAYVVLNNSNGSYGRVVCRSIAAHEMQHVFQAAVSVDVEPWMREATATWAQYLLYSDDETIDLARNTLWTIRLQGAAKPLDAVGDRFEYAGMVWMKFLLDATHGTRASVLNLWRAMGAAGGWRAGLDTALPPLGVASVEEAAATFAEWNLFACKGDDGHHYDGANLTCTVAAQVPLTTVDALPTDGDTASIGPLGAAYLEPMRDGRTQSLRAALSGGRFVVRAVKMHDGGTSSSQTFPSQNGAVDISVDAWNDASRVVLVVVNLDSAPIALHYHLEGEGALPSGGCALGTHALPETRWAMMGAVLLLVARRKRCYAAPAA